MALEARLQRVESDLHQVSQGNLFQPYCYELVIYARYMLRIYLAAAVEYSCRVATRRFHTVEVVRVFGYRRRHWVLFLSQVLPHIASLVALVLDLPQEPPRDAAPNQHCCFELSLVRVRSGSSGLDGWLLHPWRKVPHVDTLLVGAAKSPGSP